MVAFQAVVCFELFLFVSNIFVSDIRCNYFDGVCGFPRERRKAVVWTGKSEYPVFHVGVTTVPAHSLETLLDGGFSLTDSTFPMF